MSEIYLANKDLTFIDYPDPDNWAVIFYFSGCSHGCKNCHNIQLKNRGVGKLYNVDEFNELVKYETEKNKTKNVVFSGGDPLFKENLEFVKEFLIKYGSLYNICIYTGHNIEYVKENNVKGFKYIKCGTFDDSKKRLSGNFSDQFILASSNQNFYDENYNLISEDGILIYDKKDLYYLKINERKGD